jgi:acetylglutamate kinase
MTELKEGPIVVKIGGTTLEDPKTSPQLWDAIAALSKSRPEGVIVVHGGGKAVDRLLDKLGFTVERQQGLRVTPPEQIGYITGVLAGTLNKSIVANLIKRGVKAVGLCLGDGGSIPATRKTLPDADLGLVGEIPITPGTRSGGIFGALTGWHWMPIVSSIGIDSEGTLLNINADDGAAGLAYHVHASTLVLMTDVPGILDAQGQVIPTIDGPGIERLIQQGTISGGMIPKARAAAVAAAQIQAPVIILSGNDPASLANWSAGRPAGTRVLAPPVEDPTHPHPAP